jgi:hypothetical protein
MANLAIPVIPQRLCSDSLCCGGLWIARRPSGWRGSYEEILSLLFEGGHGPVRRVREFRQDFAPICRGYLFVGYEEFDVLARL